ncbi:MAG: hypothetical protein JWN78_3291 [Bacteroidota bacterium]|nr:hypothetical protein [Bacteroidota bacterium]
METTNRTALITGATSGIGYELAKLFAADNYHLIIVSRQPQKLYEVADRFKEFGAKKVTILPTDLSVDGNAENLYAEVKNQGLEVDVLVNDAGIGEYGFFKDTDLKQELKLIHLNVVTTVVLTKLFMKDMLQKKSGGKILQLASIASYMPHPRLAVYAASKSFILSFTDALIDELKDTNVTMTALVPGPTDTDFFRKAGMENTKAAQNDPEDPQVVAKIGYDALMKGEHHAYAPKVRPQIIMSSVMSNEQNAAMAEKQIEEVGEKK